MFVVIFSSFCYALQFNSFHLECVCGSSAAQLTMLHNVIVVKCIFSSLTLANSILMEGLKAASTACPINISLNMPREEIYARVRGG